MVVDRDAQRVERLRQGVQLRGHRDAPGLKVLSAQWHEAGGSHEAVVLCVRPGDIADALELVRPLMPQATLINAVGGLAALEGTRTWSGEAMHAVVNSELATLPDGDIETAFSNFIWLGNLQRTLTPAMAEVQRALSFAAPTLTTRVIEGIVWGKAAFCLEAALPSLAGLEPLEFFSHAASRDAAANLVRSALGVAERSGIAPIGFDFFDPPLYRAHGTGQQFTLDTWIRNAWIRHEQFRVGCDHVFSQPCGLGCSLTQPVPDNELLHLLREWLSHGTTNGVNTAPLQAYERLAARHASGERIALNDVQALAEVM
jgi:hypothetical protein